MLINLILVIGDACTCNNLNFCQKIYIADSLAQLLLLGEYNVQRV